jgi:hypothetical protein
MQIDRLMVWEQGNLILSQPSLTSESEEGTARRKLAKGIVVSTEQRVLRTATGSSRAGSGLTHNMEQVTEEIRH